MQSTLSRGNSLPSQVVRHLQQHRRNHHHVVPLMINGKDVHGEKFDVTGPLTNKTIWSATSATREHVESAVSSAQAAFPAWSATKPNERRDIFLAAAHVMQRRKEELIGYMHQEIGAGVDMQEFIFNVSVEGLKDTAGRIAGSMTGTLPCSTHDGMRAMVEKVPYGVVLGIGPWNAPYHLGLRSITFPLAAGNTAIFKGPEAAPRCAWAIADIFREAGIPAGCLNLITHNASRGPAITEQLVAHPSVRKINFTGSTRVGRLIAASAGKHLKPVLMELGGKNSAIVLSDADIKNSATQCALGAFMNSGQICMSTERILVHESVASQFREAFAAAVRAEILSKPDMRPVVIDTLSADKNRALIADAIRQGAHLEQGTAEIISEAPTQMLPTVISGVEKNMDIYQTESFGPSVSLFSFKTESEALELANDTEYGLSAAVFTENLQTGLRLARQLESGAVHINSMTVHDEYPLPHGGVKSSGFGRFNGYQGLDEFLYTKTVTWMV